ncbi:MAG: 2-oxo acid dehydrogenase subunit E2 [Actinomycetota bacterium]|nr:2-oxo acid dehydrogenase subunit E2 [Actinomycetota bacterium]
MAYRFCLPDLGEGVAEGEVTEWLIEVGQDVREDQPMVEVETDKATVEIACPVDGVVHAVHAVAGERVAVGGLLVTFLEEEGETAGDRADDSARALAVSSASSDGSSAPTAATAEPAPSVSETDSPRHVRATPSARRLARELGVELASVGGSGPEGAITDRDIRDAAGQRPGDGASATAGGHPSGERREPLRGVRRRIAERLTISQQEIPKVTVVEECDFTELSKVRGELSYTAFAVRAAVSGLQEFPDFNATLEGDEIVYRDRYGIGIAAQGPRGLMVPVLKGADSRSLVEIDQEVSRLASEVRADTIAPEDLRGGTFTLTLAGKLGGLFATPLVNPGEAAILGIHRIAPRPVVRDGEIVVGQIGLVSCSFDHRITDGARASMFLLHVIDALQEPDLT